ncbi:MAG: hypothetical protein K0B81_06070 [Candidatus Cloacimonetes bacterium]|nr:hypothetical protein [Candidatus Cloacimonadota bacterium]
MRLSLFSLLLLLGFLIISCSSSSPTENEFEEPQPPEFASIPDFVFTFPGEYPEDIYTSEEVEYQEEMVIGYSLDQFVPIDVGDEENIDLRPLYAYEIVGEDDFTPRMRLDQDLHWSLFSNGYLLPEKEHRTFISSSSELRPYNVKFAETINLYRKIDVIKSDNDPVMFEVRGMVTIELDNDVVIPLSSFITDYITGNPENFDYKLIDINNGEYDFSWSELSNGFWHINNETAVILLMDDETEPDYQIINFLMSIELHEI